MIRRIARYPPLNHFRLNPGPMSEPRTRTADPRPGSDVSAVVGWLGLGALTVWVMVCHFWPELVTALGLPSRAERLTGPNAALAGLVLVLAAAQGWARGAPGCKAGNCGQPRRHYCIFIQYAV